METITREPDSFTAEFVWRETAGVRLLTCEALERNGFTNAFSTRLGGVSPMPSNDLNLAGFADDTAENIHENRRRFLTAFDDVWILTSCWQVHGHQVRVITDDTDALNDEVRCDALTTDQHGILLGVKTADCVPILLADPRTGAISAVHAGWRGTLACIVQRSIERMTLEYGTKPENIIAAIGPAASTCCYEVGADVVSAFQDAFKYTESFFSPTSNGHALVNLKLANSLQLLSTGVELSNIHISQLCTMCKPDLFFSYRQEKKAYGRTGRLMSVIGRPKLN